MNRLSYAGTNRVRFEGCVSARHLIVLTLPGTPSPRLAAKLIDDRTFGKPTAEADREASPPIPYNI